MGFNNVCAAVRIDSGKGRFLVMYAAP